MRTPIRLFLTLAFFGTLAEARSRTDSLAIHYGTWLRSPTGPYLSLPWTEVTFYPAGRLSVRTVKDSCEDVIGFGHWEQKTDTLILSQVSSWTTLACKSEFVKKPEVRELKYLIRSVGKDYINASPMAKEFMLYSSTLGLYRLGTPAPR